MGDENIELGGSITLAGFGDLDYSELIVVKKVVGGYARKFSDLMENFESLKLTMKPVHKTEASVKFELHSQLIAGGKPANVEVTDRNLFVALDTALKKLESQVKK